MKQTIEHRDDRIIYNIKFDSLTDLYQYLKSNPKVNTDVFETQASIDNDESFSGVPLKKAIEHLVTGYKVDLDNFITLTKKFDSLCKDTTDNRKLERGLYGGIGLPSLVAAGVPDCMLRYNRDLGEKFRNIYFSLSYRSSTTKEAIRNRGLIALFLVKSLEQNNNIVNFRASEYSDMYEEVINLEVVLKRPGDIILNIEKCYYPMVAREFLRRILFRVLESVPVHNRWGYGYGSPMEASEIRDLFKIPKNDIIIPEPYELDIYGDDIYEDTINAIKNLNLENEFDIEKIKSLKKKNE